MQSSLLFSSYDQRIGLSLSSVMSSLSNFLPFSLTVLKKLTGFSYKYCKRPACEVCSIETIEGQEPPTPSIIPPLSTFLLRN